MRQTHIKILLPIFALVVVTSQQEGVSVTTDVQTTGSSNVKVETNIESNNSESTTYRKVEVDVNGKKEVYESTEEGSQTITIKGEDNDSISVEDSDINNESAKIELSEEQINEPKVESTYVSFTDYLFSYIKDFFANMFS